MNTINGKHYPLWQGMIEKKDDYIGGQLKEYDSDSDEVSITTITDIVLEPNGEDSAYFSVIGEDFSCGFDVYHGGIYPAEYPWIGFSRTYLGNFYIKAKGN